MQIIIEGSILGNDISRGDNGPLLQSPYYNSSQAAAYEWLSQHRQRNMEIYRPTFDKTAGIDVSGLRLHGDIANAICELVEYCRVHQRALLEPQFVSYYFYELHYETRMSLGISHNDIISDDKLEELCSTMIEVTTDLDFGLGLMNVKDLDDENEWDD